MSKHITPLQHSVIQRLRDAGFNELADMVHQTWSLGELIPLSLEPDPEGPHAALIADLLRANLREGTKPSLTLAPQDDE